MRAYHHCFVSKVKLSHTTQLRGMASTLRMRTAISPGQWQPWIQVIHTPYALPRLSCTVAATVTTFTLWSWRLKECFCPRLGSKRWGRWSYVRPLRLAMPCWWALTRTKQLSMAATARVIWLCACVRYWPYRGVDWRKMSAQAPRKKSRGRFPWMLLVLSEKMLSRRKEKWPAVQSWQTCGFLTFWEIKACFMADFKRTLFYGKYYVGTPFSKSLPTCIRVKIDVLTWCLRQKGLRKRWIIFAFFDSDSPLPRGTKRYYKGTKEWFWSFVQVYKLACTTWQGKCIVVWHADYFCTFYLGLQSAARPDDRWVDNVKKFYTD